jgi:predicted Rossmann fold nucleotide-binding protein DprA/Smf involved in DNA uptake
MKAEDSLATILLVSRLAGDGLQPLKASEFWPLCDQIGPPGALLGATETDLVGRHGVAVEMATRIVTLLDRATAMAFELDRLDQSGISTVTPYDEHYPSRFRARLRAKAPPLLHSAGALDLLGRPGLGVVGSRDISDEGGAVAKNVAERGVRLGFPIVSGGARGVDQRSMSAAIAGGGAVVGVLADSLLRALRSPDARRAVLNGTTVMVTPYRPDAPFSAGNAMGRNKLIYALSVRTLVVASGGGAGGTWSGAVEALKEGFGSVVVWRGRGEGPGNGGLQERGATPITSLDELDDLLAAPEIEPPEADVQPSLFER